MAVKLTVASYYDPTGIEAAQKALDRFKNQYKLGAQVMAGSTGDLAKASLEWQRFGMKIDAVGQKAQNLGKTLTKSLTVPIVGLGAAAASSAIEMESAFAQVRKTVDATDEVYQQLYDDAVALSTVHAISAADVATLESLAAQLGVATENLNEFAEIAYSLDIATNLNAEEAITQLAQFINITGNSQENAERLASTIVALGNTSATTEANILDMSMRIAAAGSQAGMTDQDILALSAALSSLGMEAEAGGTAMSKTIAQISKDAATGSENLQVWADLAGMSVDEFVKAWQTGGDVTTETFTKVVQGMASASNESGELLVLLDELGISSIRQSDALQRLAGSGDLLTRSIETANAAYAENTALANEVANFEDTLASKWAITANKAKAAAIEVGGPMVDALSNLIDAAEPMLDALARGAKAFSNLNKQQQQTIIKVAAMVAALGPLTTITGKLTSTVGGVVQGIGKLGGTLAAHQAKVLKAAEGTENYAAALAKAEKQTKAFNVASKAAGVMMGVTIAAAAVSAYLAIRDLVDATSVATMNFNEAVRSAKGFGTVVSDMRAVGIDTATALSEYGHTVQQLDDIIASSEQAITDILATAIAERRDLRDDEVEDIRKANEAIAQAQMEKFDTYMAALDTEMTMLMAEEDALTTKEAAQYVANIEKKYDDAIAVVEEGYEQEVSLINAHYRATGEMGSAAYQAEIEAAKQKRDERVAIATDEKNKLLSTTAEMMESLSAEEAQGWAEISRTYGDMTQKTRDFIEEYGEAFSTIPNETMAATRRDYRAALAEMDLDTASAFLAMQSTIVAGGGTLTAENAKIAEDMISSFEGLPKEYQDIAKDTLLKLIEGMEEEWPWVTNAADMTADQIVGHMRDELALGDSYSIGYNEGYNLTTGYAAGAVSQRALAAVRNAATTAVNAGLAAIQAAQRSGSPAKEFMPLGEYATEGYAVGLADQQALRGVTAAAQSAVDAASAGFNASASYGAQTASYSLAGASTAGVVNNYWNVTLSASDATEMQSWEDFWRRAQEKAQRVERMG